MKRSIMSVLGTIACAVLFMVPAIAANQQSTTGKATTETAKASTASWPAESLTGTITAVDPAQRIVIIKDSSGVPFDMVVGRSTRIESGSRELKLGDLSSDVNQKASVNFVPEGRGDVARSIRING